MSNDDLIKRLDILESRNAIERLIYTYAQAYDRHDIKMLESIWHEGAVLALGDDIGNFSGVQAILDAAHQLWAKTPAMHHWMANALIDVEGDTATAATALDCFVTDTHTGPTQVGGLYRDRFERRNEKWGFVERRFELHYWTPIANWKPEAGVEALSKAA
ncbi:nuclear transport factor 2 family protein [Burkholderia cepacia]|uniref:nuclear transport factor 2 family protein n=1 Tax=Burkholderia cepacia TaxID=292 RepID=UPI00158D9B58|nr:nuclear transport factor 2 family protein [Burkholderia cepacia]